MAAGLTLDELLASACRVVKARNEADLYSLPAIHAEGYLEGVMAAMDCIRAARERRGRRGSPWAAGRQARPW